MRMSADPQSPHYSPQAGFYDVYFDGVKVSHVRDVDTVEGWIEVYDLDRTAKEGHYVVKKCYGVVRLQKKIIP